MDKNITFDDLYEKCKSYIKDNNELENIEKAYSFALKKHKGLKRKSGDDYITHPLNVAYILTSLNVDSTTIIAALLHETINHGDATYDEIEENFGEEVKNIIVSISKINKLELTDDSQTSAIYLRKVLVGLSEDVRVLFIKLADRLHNMRTIDACSLEKQKQRANETLNVLIPIAHRLGINSIKSELEDLCLKYLKPEVYNDILDHLSASHEELNNTLMEMKNNISNLLKEHGIKHEIKARVKSIHSIYNKLTTGRKWSDIYDILALRVFVEKESDCYLTVGIIHSKYKPIAKRFKDYIAKPKENNYQSLHTSVIGEGGYPFEVQVRTYEMDEIAEKGIASHWSYKEHGSKKAQNIMEQKLEMFRAIMESNDENTTEGELESKLHNEILNQPIYVFTPKGDVVELPLKSSPVDFAYRIHSSVGDKTVGAIVNNNIVPLDYELNDGDVVSIKTSNSATPRKDWLSFVKTSQAKNKIKSYFSKQDRIMYIERGKDSLEKEIRRKKLAYSDVINDTTINKLKIDLKLEDLDDIYLSVGSLRYTPSYIINLVFEEKKDVSDVLMEKVSKASSNANYDANQDVIVNGISDIKVSLSKCCKPVLGDPIVGYVTKGQGVSVHRKTCPKVRDLTDRLINVSWHEIPLKMYKTDLYIKVIIGDDYIVDIITKASLKNVFIENVKTTFNDNFTMYNITVNVKNTEELENFITLIKSLKYVREIERIYS